MSSPAYVYKTVLHLHLFLWTTPLCLHGMTYHYEVILFPDNMAHIAAEWRVLSFIINIQLLLSVIIYSSCLLYFPHECVEGFSSAGQIPSAPVPLLLPWRLFAECLGCWQEGRLHFLARSWAHSLLPSDHASLCLYFRFPGVLSLDILLSPSREEQCSKCSGCWGRWTHSWKASPESWHRRTESAVISPPPRS